MNMAILLKETFNLRGVLHYCHGGKHDRVHGAVKGTKVSTSKAAEGDHIPHLV